MFVSGTPPTKLPKLGAEMHIIESLKLPAAGGFTEGFASVGRHTMKVKVLPPDQVFLGLAVKFTQAGADLFA